MSFENWLKIGKTEVIWQFFLFSIIFHIPKISYSQEKIRKMQPISQDTTSQ